MAVLAAAGEAACFGDGCSGIVVGGGGGGGVVTEDGSEDGESEDLCAIPVPVLCSLSLFPARLRAPRAPLCLSCFPVEE